MNSRVRPVATVKRAVIGHKRKLSKPPARVRPCFQHPTFRYAAWVKITQVGSITCSFEQTVHRPLARPQHRRETVDQQRLQHGAMNHAELSQHRVVHSDTTAQQLEAGVLTAQPAQFARIAHDPNRGIERGAPEAGEGRPGDDQDGLRPP